MNTALMFHWPELPPLPPPGVPVLIRVDTTPTRQQARQELRAVLRQALAVWSGLPSEQLPLGETSRGPVWREQVGRHDLDISLSYTEGKGWIGLLRGGWIGLDIMQIKHLPEAEAVARLYLGSEAWKIIEQSDDPPLAFATMWTTLEARLKCLKRGLTELSERQVMSQPDCTVQSMVLPESQILTVATCPAQKNNLRPSQTTSATNASDISAPARI